MELYGSSSSNKKRSTTEKNTHVRDVTAGNTSRSLHAAPRPHPVRPRHLLFVAPPRARTQRAAPPIVPRTSPIATHPPAALP